MSKKFIEQIASNKLSKYLTPMMERCVYGLVYPAVLGASIVEVGIKAHGFVTVLPWITVLLIFVLDYVVTASETSESPQRGNIFTALADLVAAISFLGAYLVSATWDGTAPFSDEQVRYLVYVIFGLHLAYALWYSFRWATVNSVRTANETQKMRYASMVKWNATVFCLQLVIVLFLGILTLTVVSTRTYFYLMMAVSTIGLLIRVTIDYKLGLTTTKKD